MSNAPAAGRPAAHPTTTQTTVDTWLGDGEVLATLHIPHSGGDAGVVICPPIGYEYAVAYRTLRHLADRLATSGIAAVRFDHPGFGDSTADLGPGALERGASLAAEALRQAGSRRILYLGLGSGALIAARNADQDPGAAGLVLWDPAASGRLWLRRQRSLYAIEVGDVAEPAPDGYVEIAGAELPVEFADEIATLEYPAGVVERVPTLVAVRQSTGAAAPVLPKSLRALAERLDVVEVPGHEDSLDMSSILASIPAASVEVVRRWILESFPPSSAVSAPLVVPGATTVVRFDGLEEELVRFGDSQLFGIETRPVVSVEAGAELPAVEMSAVVLHNGSAEHRVGATRHQVDLARRLAAEGMRVLRFDRRGTGESSPVRADEPSLLFTQDWLDDHEAALAHLALPRERVGVVGMCVGGWIGLAATPGTTRFVAALALNDHRVEAQDPPTTRPEPGAAPEAPSLSSRLVAVAKRRLPYPALVALASRGIVRFAEPNLRRTLAAGTDVLLLLSPEDSRIFADHGGPTAVRRLGSRRLPGTLTVVERPTGDHALYSPGIRRAAIELSVELAVRQFGLGGGGGVGGGESAKAPSRI